MVNPRDSNDNFVLFAQPNEDSVLKRKKQKEKEKKEPGASIDEEEEHLYDCIREYTCTIIRNDETKRNYFLIFQAGSPVFYIPCPASLALHIRGTVRIWIFFPSSPSSPSSPFL